MEVNLLWWIVVVAAFVTRFWRIDFPRYVMYVDINVHSIGSFQSGREIWEGDCKS